MSTGTRAARRRGWVRVSHLRRAGEPGSFRSLYRADAEPAVVGLFVGLSARGRFLAAHSGG